MLKMKKMLPQPRSFWPRSLRRLAAFVALATTLGFLISPGLPLYGAESIEFLPPPMEGTISLGVYDSTGKLVRVLHREADLDEFRIALNGLVTKWDGNDDSGAACPAGTYRVRGYRVGELQIEGIEFHGNDWSEDEEAPRIVKLTKMAALPDGSLLFNAELAELAEAAEPQRFILAPQAEEEATESTESTESTEAPEQPEAPDSEEVAAETTLNWTVKPAPDTPFPEAATEAPAPDATPPAWSWTPRLGEDGVPTALDIRSADGLKNSSISLVTKGNPVPIAVSVAGDRLFLLEATQSGQELRGFDLSKLVGTQPQLLFSRMVLWSKEYDTVAARLKFPDGTPFVAQPQLRVRLVRNPLIKKKSPIVDIQVKIDAEGAYLATSDGLPLAQVSETPFLKWAVIGRPEKTKGSEIVLFESDGSTIEEYRATQLSRMMAFDAGLFTLKGKRPVATAATPVATPTPTPAATPQASATPSPELP